MEAESAGGVAGRVRAARGYANLTQEQLAERLGVDKQTVKRWENPGSRYAPDAGRRIAIAAICEVPAEFIEHGFGELPASEIDARLERIEATLGYNRAAITSVREWVSEQITGLGADEDAGEAGAPTPRRDPDRRPAEQQRPPGRSHRRS